jgi:hypothetical protein
MEDMNSLKHNGNPGYFSNFGNLGNPIKNSFGLPRLLWDGNRDYISTMHLRGLRLPGYQGYRILQFSLNFGLPAQSNPGNRTQA